jgi:transcriptional regulator GlxA family with amidase domain
MINDARGLLENSELLVLAGGFKCGFLSWDSCAECFEKTALGEVGYSDSAEAFCDLIMQWGNSY